MTDQLTTLRVTSEAIASTYAKLERIGALGDGPEHGYLRPAWHDEEDEAIRLIISEAERIGFKPRFDAIGNVALERPGKSGRFVEAGSHLDTVVAGGNFDGAAGVVAGLHAFGAIVASGTPLFHGLRLRIWRGEESATNNTACKGSRAAFGLLPRATLDTSFRGTKLRDAIRRSGFDPLPIETERPTITKDELDRIIAHVELHIEQANSLERKGLDIGVVTAIRGPRRWKVELVGSFDHSGGTPMGPAFRRDTNLALGYIMVELDRLADDAIAKGNDLVQTIGVINSDQSINDSDPRVYQNATAKVSGYCYFMFEVRSTDGAFLKDYNERAFELIRTVADRFGVQVSASLVSESKPLEQLDRVIEDTLARSADVLGLKGIRMPSGALHDCLYLGQQVRSDDTNVPIGMVFIPCRDGKSHTPEEHCTFEQIANGASVLATAFLALAAER